MQRLTRAELASRLTPFPPGDAFWARAIAAGEAAIGVGSEALAEWEDDTGKRADSDESNITDEASDRPRGRSHATIERVEGRGTAGVSGPLATGDMIDVGERSFVVVAVDRTAAGGVTYRIDLVPERDAE
ncbi:hypothetical protein [Halorubrum laminariae]|uniref:Head-tail adaptor protein n=1 Tax=Halorubrum laminariae TaxID=1433523 RepID=A0ABD6C1L8_9EURY|nr:hypothetical protein [Halorubrum laminariae]